jgi:hypothetical protein
MRSHLLRAGTALVVPLALTLAVAPVVGAQRDPTDESIAFDAMLVAGDLAWPASGTGVSLETDPSVINLPGYVDNAGVRETAQNWSATDPVRTVFDFRFQFPDAASAEAFLDASEEILGEIQFGSVRQEPPASPLPDTRYYHYEDTVFGTGVIGHNYLMRHANLVAKVYVSGPDVAESDGSDVAAAAASRMKQAVGEPSPTTAPGTPEPSLSADPAAEAAAVLLSRIPESIRPGCDHHPYTDGSVPSAGELAEFTCQGSDTATLYYELYDSVEALDEQYDSAREFVQLLGYDHSGNDCAAGSFDGSWTLAGEEAGRIICSVDSQLASIIWSYPERRVLSRILDNSGDANGAYQLWLTAGPV